MGIRVDVPVAPQNRAFPVAAVQGRLDSESYRTRRRVLDAASSVRLVERCPGDLDRDASAGDQQSDRVRADIEQRFTGDHAPELRQERAALPEHPGDPIDLHDAALVLGAPVNSKAQIGR